MTLTEDNTVFSNEERRVYTNMSTNSRYSISDHFRDNILEIRNDTQEEIIKRNKRIEKWLSYINDEIRIGTSEPIINTLFKGIESDVVSRIKKLETYIDQSRIEGWLLNFATDEERLVALKLLDKLTLLRSREIIMLGTALFNELNSMLSTTTLNECRFTSIGSITSGSTQIIRTFQENNRIPKKWFIYNSEIEKLDDIKVIVFLDDFVGTGDTFINWYEENKSKIRPERIYYGSFGAFENGIKKIKRKTGIDTVTGRMIQESEKVLDGKLYSQKDRQNIRRVIEKYRGIRIPKEFSFGYDNCQLLYAFENNIPNNSLGILWFAQNWTPLMDRR